MTRLVFLACSFTFFCPVAAIAQVSTKDAAGSASVQRAMLAARAHLRANRAGEAVVVLEGELVNASGNAPFIALLREAYAAHLHDMQAKKADEARISYVQQRIKALDGVGSPKLGPTPPAAPNRDTSADILPPAPPIPEPPLEIVPAAPAVDTSPGAGVKSPLPKPPTPVSDDPFQQTPRNATAPGNLIRASEAFGAKRYAQAAAIYAEADRAHERFADAQRDEWAYCRLYAIGAQLNRPQLTAADLVKLSGEVETASQGISDRLRPFAGQLIAEIRKRSPAARVGTPSETWELVETASFRIHHHGSPELAAEVGRTAEAARKAMYERWSGPPAADWTPRCDLYLHSTGAEYAKATGKSADQCGHSTVGIQGGRVVSRRMDLRADEPALLDGVLPSEVTHLLLADLFADQPLPRWAAIGIAALSESPEGVARYRRAVPALLKEKKLFAVGPFIDRGGFPDATAVTPFYAESISLVSYLVELKGPKAFTAFLQEGPRRGYSRALTTHYGFKDAADLQDKWVKHTLGGQ
jgi:hypothetical protein